MFERYTQDARRVIFLAREEAIQYGSPYIESEHLLLGILRESEALAIRIGGEKCSVGSFRKEVDAKTTIRQSASGPREVPFSDDTKRILTFAAKEADDLGHRPISLGHFLLGILRVEKCIAARILQSHGATLLATRQETVRDMQLAGL